MPRIRINTFCSELDPEVQKSTCAPVAAGNIIAYLARTNRPRLIPTDWNSSWDYGTTKLVDALARLMETDEEGTYTHKIVPGIKKYVMDRGYRISCESRGDDFLGSKKRSNTPTPYWLMKGVLGPHNAMLVLGEYKYNEHCDWYEPVEAKNWHSVTLAGFNRAFGELIIHDPMEHYKPTKPEYFSLGVDKVVDRFCRKTDF